MLEVSAGELFDRISILELKLARLPEPARGAVAGELSAALAERNKHFSPNGALDALSAELAITNRVLWDTEERLRNLERSREFGEEFIALARAVYTVNDRRAALKRRIDEFVGSPRREHKSYVLPEL